MTRWHSLYLSSDDAQQITALIQSFFDHNQYRRYDPFGALPGMSYPQTVKLFMQPSAQGWTRLLVDGEADLDVIAALVAAVSPTMDALSVVLDGDQGSVHGWRDGALLSLATWAHPHLSDPTTSLDRILSTEVFDLPPLSQGQVGTVPLDQLPDDVQRMARDINADTANSLFQKMSQRLMKTIGQRDAKALVGGQPNWDGQGGQYIRTVMQHLTIPEPWRTPDFATVRTVYGLQSRQQHGTITLTDSDQAMLATYPDIDRYLPLYAGKTTH